MNITDWKKRLQNAGFEQVSNIRSVKADALDSAEGYAATAPNVLDLDAHAADALESALSDAQIFYEIVGDQWYIFASETAEQTEIHGLSKPLIARNDAPVALRADQIDPDVKTVTFTSDGRGVALDRSTQEVVRFDYAMPATAGSQELTADAFVSREDDPWLHAILSDNFQTKEPFRTLWALGAYLRYRKPDLSSIRQALEKNEPIRSAPQERHARALIDTMRVDSETVLERLFFADAQALYDDLVDAYDDAVAGTAIEEQEWQSLCLDREALTIRLAILAPGDTKNDAYALAAKIDALGDQLLIDSNVSQFVLDDETLRRGVSTGDHTWWLRPHALV